MSIVKALTSPYPIPVVLIIFRRPDTTAKVLEAIRNARPQQLFVIEEKVDWPCEVHEIYSDQNLGLRERILSGLDRVFSQVDKAIILEDDCLPTPSFFAFCSEVLHFHSKSTEVALVSGFNFAPYVDKTADYFFSKLTFIWGWATWARTWKEFRAAPQKESWSAQELEGIEHTFSSHSQQREFLSLANKARDLNTWDVSLAVWVRQSKYVTVIPRLNLISNIGFGNEATHTKFEAFDMQVAPSNFDNPIKHPNLIALDPVREKKMWQSKFRKWIVFPILHPFDFVGRFVSYFGIKLTRSK
jgi:hypothetical protein